MSLYHEEFEGEGLEQEGGYQTGQRPAKKQRQPYHSIPLRKQATQAKQPQTRTTGSYAAMQTQAPKSYVSRAQMPVKPDVYSLTPSHTSTIRHTDEYGRNVLQQGNKRLVVQHSQKQKPRFHWVFFVGVGMLATVGLWIFGQWAITSIQAHNLDSTYGYPRFWQTDEVLGLDNDNSNHKTHLILQNINGKILLIVIPAGNVAKASIYSVATLYGSDAASYPATATFQDVNNDGKIDVIVNIDSQKIVYLNTGTGFKPQTQQ